MQKLPGERLSLHGYTKQWGFFSGTCPGSGALPYEQSCEEIRRQLPQLQERITFLLREQEKTIAGERPLVTTVRIGRGYDLVRLMKKVELGADKPGEPIEHVFVTYQHEGETRRQNIEPYKARTRADAARLLVGEEVGRLEKEIQQLRMYESWCQERVREWEERPLTEINRG
jgi:hypothetical protein